MQVKRILVIARSYHHFQEWLQQRPQAERDRYLYAAQPESLQGHSPDRYEILILEGTPDRPDWPQIWQALQECSAAGFVIAIEGSDYFF